MRYDTAPGAILNAVDKPCKKNLHVHSQKMGASDIWNPRYGLWRYVSKMSQKWMECHRQPVVAIIWHFARTMHNNDAISTLATTPAPRWSKTGTV